MNIIAKYVTYQKPVIMARLKLNGAVVLLTSHQETPRTIVDSQPAPRPTYSEQRANVATRTKNQHRLLILFAVRPLVVVPC